MNRRGFLALSGLTVAAAGADDVARLLAQARTTATGAVVETTAGRIRDSEVLQISQGCR